VGDTSKLVHFLKAELEKLQIALSQKDKEFEQLVVDHTTEKTNIKSQLSAQQGELLQKSLENETLQRKREEQELYLNKCKERIETQKKTIDRSTEERNEMEEE